MSELENTIKYLSKSFKKNNRLLLLATIVIAVIWLFNKVPEIGSVLIASYLIALIIEPWINKLERIKLSRTSALISILFFSVATFTGFMLLVLPNIAEQVLHLAEKLPSNLELLRTKALNYCKLDGNNNTFIRQAVRWSLEKADFSNIDSNHFTTAFKTISNALMGGYSVALAALNFFLMPFFVFYLSRDLNNFHFSMQKFFPELKNQTFIEVSLEIVASIRAFFKGQIKFYLTFSWMVSLFI